MPKLIYLPVQGRAQAIRYLLASKGVEYEDSRLPYDEWMTIKAAGTYGTSQLPIWVGDDGKWYNQSIAILKLVGHEHGYGTSSASALYESEWFYATIVDCLEKPDRMAIMRDDASEEAKHAAIACFTSFLDRLEAHWADGRAHVAGDSITHADFALLALATGQLDNAHAKHADIHAAVSAKLHSSANVQRVLQPVRELCAAQIAALSPSPI